MHFAGVGSSDHLQHGAMGMVVSSQGIYLPAPWLVWHSLQFVWCVLELIRRLASNLLACSCTAGTADRLFLVSVQ